jgi:hypothetical protein
MMMTTAETAATDTILAIDLDKFKIVVCRWLIRLARPHAVWL